MLGEAWPVTGTFWRAYVGSEHSRLCEEQTFIGQPFIITRHTHNNKQPMDQALMRLMVNFFEIYSDKYTKSSVIGQLSESLSIDLTKES